MWLTVVTEIIISGLLGAYLTSDVVALLAKPRQPLQQPFLQAFFTCAWLINLPAMLALGFSSTKISILIIACMTVPTLVSLIISKTIQPSLTVSIFALYDVALITGLIVLVS